MLWDHLAVNESSDSNASFEEAKLASSQWIIAASTTTTSSGPTCGITMGLIHEWQLSSVICIQPDYRVIPKTSASKRIYDRPNTAI
jgi:hypothetical protein